MAGIPHELVARGIEHVVHGHCELRHAKACTEVPPLLGHDVNVTFAYLVHELIQLLAL